MDQKPKNFAKFLNSSKQQIENFLGQILPTIHIDDSSINSSIHTAIRYSALSNGGKRLRPALVYATGAALNTPPEKLNAVAASVELIHCYSLIHDDLPAMDNSDLRRGKPSCHKTFNEATAILAGDALQTLAFEILSDQNLNPHPANVQVQMINVLAKAAGGSSGMILGQAQDLASERNPINLSQLKNLHQLKTGALISAAVQLGALAANCSDTAILQDLHQYSKCIGLAFQVSDDILDVTANTETLGKPTQADQQHNKATFPALMGIEGAKKHAESLYKQALHVLQGLNLNTHYLQELGIAFVCRDF